MEVQVRCVGIACVTQSRQYLARLHMIAEFHLQTAGVQVRVEREASVAEIPRAKIEDQCNRLLTAVTPQPVAKCHQNVGNLDTRYKLD
jgi:hypothetical protein